MAEKELIQGPGVILTPDPVLPQVKVEADPTVVAFLSDLANSASPTKGPGMLGFGAGLSYPVGSLGKAVQDALAGGGGGGGGSGTSAYVHFRYSNDAGVTFTSSGGITPGAYLGTYSGTSATAPTSVSAYSWALIRGATGPAGPTGAIGPAGPTGATGTPGPVGPSGARTYFHVAYANNSTGTVGFNQTSGLYIGTYSDTTAADSLNPADYTWRLFQGAQGPAGTQGIPGTPGANGLTPYLHLKYSNDGGASFTAGVGETPGSWLGQLVDFTPTDSANPADYTWSKIQGEPGAGGFTLTASGTASLVGANGARKAPTGSNVFDGGAYSNESFPAGAYCFFTAEFNDKWLAAGLNDDPTTDNSFNSLNFYWFVRGDGTASPVINGSFITLPVPAYSAGTRFGVIRKGSIVQFLRNDVLVHEGAAAASSQPLFFDSAFQTPGASITNIVVGAAGVDGAQGAVGPQGAQGVPGTPGANGLTPYFHVAYASNSTGTVGFNQIGGLYIGTYVDYNPTDSTNPASYTWRLFQGAQGPQGLQGIPGNNGANGQTSYLHLKYSNDGGATFTAAGGETPGAYLGQLVDFVSADSTNPADYTWALIQGAQGPQGIQGPTGANGLASYIHVKWSNDGGATFTSSGGETPGAYIGVVTDNNPTDPTSPGAYTWALVKGADGATGIQGPPGANGLPSYLHIKWSNDGGATFTAAGGETPGTYIGTYTDSIEADSNSPSAYTWALVQGPTGAPGAPGSPGSPGSSVFVATVYLQTVGTPAAPTGGSFNFSSSSLTPPSGWSATRPAYNPAAATYAASFTFNAGTPGATVSGGTWSTPLKIDDGASASAVKGFYLNVNRVLVGASGTATGTVTLNSDGTTTTQRSGFSPVAGPNWYLPTTAGIGAQFSVQATQTGDAINNTADLNRSLSLASGVAWSLSQTSFGEKVAALNLSIIRNTTGAIEGSGQASLYVAREP